MSTRQREGGGTPAGASFRDGAPATPALGPLAPELAAAALMLARRLAAGATLWCSAPAEPSHARHVAVEFVHPVIVGKRALPAVALTGPDAPARVRAGATAGDVLVVIAGAGDPTARACVAHAAARAVDTVWIGAGPRPEPGVATHLLWLDDPTAPLAGGFVLLYHLLWELTHVCLEHPGVLPAAARRSPERAEATDFLYPFIGSGDGDAGALLDDLAASAEAKASESARVRATAVASQQQAVAGVAAAMAERFALGGRLLTFGNGGSSTDAAALSALFTDPPWGAPLPAQSLADEAAVITALGNDVGFELVFSRQLIASGRPGDMAVGFSTSGNSTNLLSAFAEGRRRGLYTVGLAGYDGGAMGSCGDLDRCLLVASHSVHRIQEAHAALGFALWAAVHGALSGEAPGG